MSEASNKVKPQHNGDMIDGDEAENQMMTWPKEVLRRVNALKNIQLKMIDQETKFYEELHLLECRYAKMYETFYDQRDKIINAEYEPTDDEAKFALDVADELADELKDKAKIDEAKDTDMSEAVKGSPR